MLDPGTRKSRGHASLRHGDVGFGFLFERILTASVPVVMRASPENSQTLNGPKPAQDSFWRTGRPEIKSTNLNPQALNSDYLVTLSPESPYAVLHHTSSPNSVPERTQSPFIHECTLLEVKGFPVEGMRFLTLVPRLFPCPCARIHESFNLMGSTCSGDASSSSSYKPRRGRPPCAQHCLLEAGAYGSEFFGAGFIGLNFGVGLSGKGSP